MLATAEELYFELNRIVLWLSEDIKNENAFVPDSELIFNKASESALGDTVLNNVPLGLVWL